jgi:hypothetical protein
MPTKCSAEVFDSEPWKVALWKPLPLAGANA